MDDITQAIGRVRRAMPRNTDVMLICDRIETLMASSSKLERAAVNGQVAGSSPAFPAKPKLTRAEIQRNYRLRKKENSNEGKR